jgi:hypothetical protein
MNIREPNRWGPLNEQTVIDFERQYGIVLPSDYRAFLIANHGGLPDPNFYWVGTSGWGSGIETLYGFREGSYSLRDYFDAREVLGISADLMAIGDDGSGSLLAIGIAGQRFGQLYYLDCEFEAGAPERELFLAASFDDFLERLCSPPDH